MNKQQDGFSLVEVLLVLIFVSFVAFAGWFVYDKNKSVKTSDSKKADTTKSTVETKEADPYERWKNYSLSKANISFKYPETWKAEVVPGNDVEKVQLTAPDTSELTIKLYNFLGGFTGDEPEVTIDAVVEGTNAATGKNFAMITTKVSEASYYTTASLTFADKGKYKAGDKRAVVPYLNSVVGKDGKGVDLSISVSGEGDGDFGKSKQYTNLSDFTNLEAYKAVGKFMESLEIK